MSGSTQNCVSLSNSDPRTDTNSHPRSKLLDLQKAVSATMHDERGPNWGRLWLHRSINLKPAKCTNRATAFRYRSSMVPGNL